MAPHDWHWLDLPLVTMRMMNGKGGKSGKFKNLVPFIRKAAFKNEMALLGEKSCVHLPRYIPCKYQKERPSKVKK
jgi:hypothetical protein